MPRITKNASNSEADASALIDQRIRELGDWLGETLALIRAAIKDADPDVAVE